MTSSVNTSYGSATEPTTVVVGCDGSWDSLTAVEAAAREAVRRRVPLTILALPSASDLYADTLEDVTRRERQGLERGRVVALRAEEHARETSPTVAVETVVTLEDSNELTQIAARAVLLVLGRHGRGGQSAFSFGSMSATFSRVFNTPVLVTGPGGHGPGIAPHPKVVVGLKGEPQDALVADAAMAEAVMRRWPLVAVHAVLGRAYPEGDDHHLLAAQARTWETLSVSTRAAAAHVRTEVVRDDPADAVLGQCGRTDLLVLGNQGIGHLRGLVPGSLTLRVVKAAPCDVLLVPAGVRPRPSAAASSSGRETAEQLAPPAGSAPLVEA